LPGVGLKLMYVLAKRLASAPIGIKQLAQFSLSIRYGGPAVFYDPLKIIQRQLEK
jgi:hypothetical protein